MITLFSPNHYYTEQSRWIFGLDTIEHDWDWLRIVDEFSHSERPDYKELALMYSFTTFADNKKAKINTLFTHNLVLDYDGGYSIDDFINTYSQFEYVLHTTYSHTLATHKFRVILPFTSPIESCLLRPHADLEPTKQSVLDYLIACFPEADVTCFQPERAFYAPSHSDPALIRYHNNSGQWLNPDKFKRVTGTSVPYVVQKKHINPLYQKNTGRPDYTTLRLGDFFKSEGLYIRQESRGKHVVICPNHSNHTDGATTGTVAYDGDGTRPPGFKCQHNACHGNGIKWLLQFYRSIDPDCFKPYCDTKTEFDMDSYFK